MLAPLLDRAQKGRLAVRKRPLRGRHEEQHVGARHEARRERRVPRVERIGAGRVHKGHVVKPRRSVDALREHAVGRRGGPALN